MDTVRERAPRLGDRVRINGFVGLFEIILLRENGMCDLKHLDSAGSDYIETELLSKELIYIDHP